MISPLAEPKITSTALPMVWWFGGNSDEREDDDSCELVAIRIDRTSANSRRIGGEIVVDAPIEDVWAILTDYDNLSSHVPNLVDSRRIDDGKSYAINDSGSVQGDGKYKCRLYQRGAQKIVGFEFGASVTMDMVENAVVAGSDVIPFNKSTSSSQAIIPEEKRIGFKCVESQFFSEFDGEWAVKASSDGSPSTTVSYVVDVRPKGPVPVVALEWRIREDVPTNLRAVKKASQDIGLKGVMAMRQITTPMNAANMYSERDTARNTNTSRERRSSVTRAALASGRDRMKNFVERMPSASTISATYTKQQQQQMQPVRVTVQWDDTETMAKYLENDN